MCKGEFFEPFNCPIRFPRRKVTELHRAVVAIPFRGLAPTVPFHQPFPKFNTIKLRTFMLSTKVVC